MAITARSSTWVLTALCTHAYLLCMKNCCFLPVALACGLRQLMYAPWSKNRPVSDHCTHFTPWVCLCGHACKCHIYCGFEHLRSKVWHIGNARGGCSYGTVLPFDDTCPLCVCMCVCVCECVCVWVGVGVCVCVCVCERPFTHASFVRLPFCGKPMSTQHRTNALLDGSVHTTEFFYSLDLLTNHFLGIVMQYNRQWSAPVHNGSSINGSSIHRSAPVHNGSHYFRCKFALWFLRWLKFVTSTDCGTKICTNSGVDNVVTSPHIVISRFGQNHTRTPSVHIYST